MMNVAVLGDTHGHLTLAYSLVRRWEVEHNESVDLILQCGDIGAYPDPERADKWTKRFAEKDPDELGFANYVLGTGDALHILADTADPQYCIDAPMLFIKGNHDDFLWLEQIQRGSTAPVPVDPYGKIQFLPSGMPYTFTKDGCSLTVLGLGGNAKAGRHFDELASESYSGRELTQVRRHIDAADVLITHDAPYGSFFPDSGSHDVTELMATSRIPFHFCGHYHKPGCRIENTGDSRSYQLNEVNFFHKSGQLRPGCMGVLRWASPEESEFEIVQDAWLDEFWKESFTNDLRSRGWR